MRRCVISVAVGGNYGKCLQRQIDSMAKYADEVDHIVWHDEYPVGSPTHQDMPYAFKSFAFLYAITMKYDSIIWMDSAVWVQGDLMKLFAIVENNDYLIFRNGWNQANWSTDDQLKAFWVTRDEAEGMPHPMACVIGVSLHNFPYQDWIFDYIHKWHLFGGEYSNANGEITSDMRCLGSRHDQTVLGFIANQHKLQLTHPKSLISYDIADSEALLLTQGL